MSRKARHRALIAEFLDLLAPPYRRVHGPDAKTRKRRAKNKTAAKSRRRNRR